MDSLTGFFTGGATAARGPRALQTKAAGQQNRAHRAAWIRLRKGFLRHTSCYGGQVGATRCCVERERNVPFYQTNPPFSEGFFDATFFTRNACSGNMPENS